MPPIVAIIGRRNVGKSTLFNKLVEEQKSIVSEVPGTTRDRFEADCIWRGKVIRLVDTGGLDVDMADDLDADVALQANIAIQTADLILFVVDAQVGPQPEDLELARALQKTKKPIIVAANKVEKQRVRTEVETGTSWTRWPLGRPFPISAKIGAGTGDLLDLMYDRLDAVDAPASDISTVSTTRVAVLGRPNVGKSSLLNAVLGQDRFITSPMAHTTREPNDVLIERGGHNYVFVDTAGIRKRAKIRAGTHIEEAGVDRSLDAVERADVALFVIDVTQKIEHQDRHLAGLLSERDASVIIVANKWDLIDDKKPETINKYEKFIRAYLPQLSYAPILFTSALDGTRVQNIFELTDKVYGGRFTQLSDDETDQFIRQAIVRHKPSRGKGVQHPKIISFTQVGVNPPKFALVISQSRKEALNPSYLAFLKNLLRQKHDFSGTPIRIVVRGMKKKHVT